MDNVKIDNKSFWESISAELEQTVSAQTYATWFEPLRIVNIEESVVTVEVPSRFYYEWIDSHYGSLIVEKIRKIYDAEMQIRYTVVVGEKDGEVKEVLSENKEQVVSRARVYDNRSKLNKRYTFGSFIQGGSNQLAKLPPFRWATLRGRRRLTLF